MQIYLTNSIKFSLNRNTLDNKELLNLLKKRKYLQNQINIQNKNIYSGRNFDKTNFALYQNFKKKIKNTDNKINNDFDV